MLNNFTKTDAKPEDITEAIGVSNRFKDPALKAAIAKQLANEGTTPVRVVAENASDEFSSKILSDTTLNRTVTDVLTDIAGNKGLFKELSRDTLLPTPDEWNQFSSISLEKKVLMADSIYRNGLQQPIVVRQLDDDHYQILAGNTRNEIYGILYDLTQDTKYQTIEAKVYGIDEITDDQAREIASDTNYVQRATLTARDRAFAIQTKIDILKRHKASSVLEKVAEQMNIKRTSVFYLSKIANIIPEFETMLNAGQITLKAAARIASWPEDIQRELYNYREKITSKLIMKLPAKTPNDQIIPTFLALTNATDEPTASVTATMQLEPYEAGCMIDVSAMPDNDSEAVLLFIPKNKLKALLRNYQDYVVKKV